MNIREMIEIKKGFLHDTMSEPHYYNSSYDYDDDDDLGNDTLIENAIDTFENDTRILFGEQYKNDILIEEMLLSATSFQDCDIVEEALLDSLADMKDKVIKTIKDLWIRFRDWLTRIIDSIKDAFSYPVPDNGSNSSATQSGGGSAQKGGSSSGGSSSGGSAQKGGSSSGGSGQKAIGGGRGNLALPSPEGGGGGGSSSGGSGQKAIGGPSGGGQLAKGGTKPSGSNGTKSEGPKENTKSEKTEKTEKSEKSENKERTTSKKKMSKADFKALKSRVISQYRLKQDTVHYKGFTYYNEDRQFLKAMRQCADISDIVSRFKTGDTMTRMDYFDKIEHIIGGNPKDRGEDGYVQNWIISKIRNNKIEDHKLKDMPLGLLTKYGMEEATALDQCNELMNIYRNLFKDTETTINNCDDAKKVKIMTRLCSQATKFGTFCIGVYTREYRKAIKFCSSIIRKIII